MGLVGGGGYSEMVVTEASHIVPMPHGLKFVECAAVPEAFCTAYDAMVLQGGLKEGDTVLIHAAGSGVGTAAIQIARAFGASRVFGTASAAKLEALDERGLSLDVAVDYRRKSFRDVIMRETDGRGVDLILDLVGATYWTDNIASLRSRGRIVLVGLVGGTMAQLNLGVLLRRRLHVVGTVMRSRDAAEKDELARSTREHLLPRFESGELFPVVDRVFDLREAHAAHAYMEDNRNVGKVVLRVRG
jgi:NADPH:quinone reductase-like Zn-dependent oxidoreductase